ncbi:hypothetical protein [Dickeya sp. NCPPB 3274]|uniref:hypothetical protein n=1 Tax=Dickeya sp. NCPPB 3274 TaxID=568766 RepID=UPI0005B36CF3|nr:hypothetical protein [Dickeya sp. NCPPB 3274]
MKIEIDTLSNYLEATLENLVHHAKEEPDLMGMIHEMDRIFHQEIFAHEYDANAATMLLAMNSYMMLSNAVFQALSGHQVAVLPVARAALESACYAYLISSDNKMGEIWFNRDKSKTATDNCRKAFTIGATVAKLKHISPDMSDYLKKLYDLSIEYGAHPNIKAISHHLHNRGLVDDKFHSFSHIGVYGENSYQVNGALLLCVDVGQAIAFLLCASAKDHPFINERKEVFHNWMDEKNQIIDGISAELDKNMS